MSGKPIASNTFLRTAKQTPWNQPRRIVAAMAATKAAACASKS